MRADTVVCRRLSSDTELDELLRRGVPEELLAHAGDCGRCAKRLATIERLRAGLAVLARTTASSADSFDIADEIMASLPRPADAPETPWWRRPWLLPAACAAVAACALLLVLLSGDAGSSLRLDAPQGATVTTRSGDRLVQGTGIDVPAPSTVRTAAGQVATLRHGDQVAQLWAHSALSIGSEGDWSIETGAVTFTTPRELLVRTRGGQVRGRGHFAVERNLDPPPERPMKILTKHRVAAASAVIALAVFTGWATLSSGSSNTAVKAPGGAFVDGQGRAHRFGLSGNPGDPFAARGSTSPNDTANDGAGDADSDQVGAFWDDDKQIISFSVPGEVLDADTGEPILDFRITGQAIESKAYGQTRPSEWAFRAAGEGKFRLDGLGLGVWRLRVTAEGYAPLTTTVNLTGLDSDPYLVVPMWAGAQLTGRVVDWKGRPVEGARIGMTECFDRKNDKTCALTKSKTDGTFSLPGLPEDQVFSIYASHPRYGFASENDIRRTPDSTEHVTIELSGIVRIYGEVSRGSEREPVAGAVVIDGKDARTTTDHNGVYELLAPLEARPEAFVEAVSGDRVIGRAASYPDSRSAWQLTWVDASDHVAEVRIDFRLAMENATLYGKITDAGGKPLPDLELDLANTAGWTRRDHETFPTYARTDQAGRYRIENIPARAGYNLKYKPPGSESLTPLGYVNVEDETEVEANFQVGTGTIRGRFVDKKTRQPIALSDRGCDRLGARRSGQTGYALPHCYDDGRFEFEGLGPGEYLLHNRIEWMASPVIFEPHDVTVPAGGIVEDVEIAIEGEGSTQWKLRVLNDKGKFVLGAYTRIHSGNTSFTSSLDVGADGIATESINDKYKTIFIDAPGYSSKELDLKGRDPAEVIEVRLERL